MSRELPTWDETSSNFEEEVVQRLRATSAVGGVGVESASKPGRGAEMPSPIVAAPQQHQQQRQNRQQQRAAAEQEAYPYAEQKSSAQTPLRKQEGSHHNQRQQQQQQQQEHQHYHHHQQHQSSYQSADQERDKDSELFACREFMLSTAERIKFVSEFMRLVEEHINNDCNLEKAALRTMSAQALRFSGPMMGRRFNEALPKEAHIVEDHNSELEEGARSMLQAVADCMSIRNTTYLSQLRRLREHCNTSTRNAVQAERAEAANAMFRARAAHEAELEGLRSDARRAADTHSAEASSLRSSCLELRNEVTRLQTVAEGTEKDKSYAVASALRPMQDQLEAQRKAQQQAESQFAARLAETVAREVESVRSELQAAAAREAAHQTELRGLQAEQAEKMSSELSSVRDQLIKTLAQLTAEKEINAARVQEARALGERDAQEARAESLATQATLKQELAAVIHRAKQEDARRVKEFEMILVKDREAQVTAFSLDGERMADRHRAELRRVQAVLEVRAQEESARLKHAHEQELKRVLRENERLQRALARGDFQSSSSSLGVGSVTGAGGDQQQQQQYSFSVAAAAPSSSSSSSSSSSTAASAAAASTTSLAAFPAKAASETSPKRTHHPALTSHSPSHSHSHSHNHGQSVHLANVLRGSVDPEPCPPPPPPLRWGALAESLAEQVSELLIDSIP